VLRESGPESEERLRFKKLAMGGQDSSPIEPSKAYTSTGRGGMGNIQEAKKFQGLPEPLAPKIEPAVRARRVRAYRDRLTRLTCIRLGVGAQEISSLAQTKHLPNATIV
jgi:hypothetical protein